MWTQEPIEYTITVHTHQCTEIDYTLRRYMFIKYNNIILSRIKYRYNYVRHQYQIIK